MLLTVYNTWTDEDHYRGAGQNHYHESGGSGGAPGKNLNGQW
jgi:hypothetical protein